MKFAKIIFVGGAKMNYKKLVEIMGHEKQLDKCLEEVIEFLEVLIKLKTKNKFNKNKMIEEMAHVYMVFRSLKIMFNISENDIQNEILWKERLLMNRYPELINDKNE